MGSEGTVLTTRDGGATWSAQTSGTQATLHSVSMHADGQRGLAVGDEGTVLTTRDGGATWSVQTSGTQATLHSVSMHADGQRGLAVGRQGTVLATRNGGATWSAQTSGTQAWLMSLSMHADGLRGWAVGRQGTVLATRDGGATWSAQTSGTQAWLTSLSMHADGQRGWAVGGQGTTVLATRDGGATWSAQTSGTQATLNSVSMHADGQRGWAVGSEGTVLTTRDGGATWSVQTSGTQATLASVSMHADGQRGWAVGGQGTTVLATRDGGATWTVARYQRSPSPLSMALAGLWAAFGALAVWLVTRHRPSVLASILDRSESDEPIASAAEDRLGYAELARGLARYLRNAATRPPLVLSIDAPWGHGKSSVMRLLQGELEAAGVRSVWFNAWHHQQEPVLLAPLLQAIRAAALPSSLSMRGLRFHGRLLLLRARKRPLASAIVVLGIVGGAAYFGAPLASALRGAWAFATDVPSALVALAANWDRFTGRDVFQELLAHGVGAFAASVFSASLASPTYLLGLVALVSLTACLVSAVQWGWRAFPEEPAVLLASLSERFKLSEAKALTAFRDAYRRHFSDVCAALEPRSLTLFIDDLDRCAPDKCAEMLEAVNYLSSSGRCFIVLGLARDMVEAQLVQHYEGTAQAYARVQRSDAQDRELEVPEAALVAYVRNYLRKLINVEVKLPSLDAMRAAALFKAESSSTPEAESSRWRRLVMRVSRWEQKWGRSVYAWGAVLLLVGVLAEPVVNLVAGLQSAASELDQRRDQAIVVSRTELAKLKDAEVRLYDALAALEAAGSHDAGLHPAVRGSVVVARQRLEVFVHALVRAEAALDAKNVGAFQTAREDAFEAEQQLEALLAPAPTAPTPVADAGPPAPPPVVKASPPALSGEVIVQHHAPPETLPWWLPWAVLVGLGVVAVTRLVREPFELVDAPRFEQALPLWSKLLVADRARAAPRELKRYVNQARYFASRLRALAPERPWLERLLLKNEPPNVTSAVDEAAVVALTALHQAKLLSEVEAHLRSGNGHPSTAHPLWKALVDEDAQAFGRVLPVPAFESFRAVVGEFQDASAGAAPRAVPPPSAGPPAHRA